MIELNCDVKLILMGKKKSSRWNTLTKAEKLHTVNDCTCLMNYLKIHKTPIILKMIRQPRLILGKERQLKSSNRCSLMFDSFEKNQILCDYQAGIFFIRQSEGGTIYIYNVNDMSRVFVTSSSQLYPNEARLTAFSCVILQSDHIKRSSSYFNDFENGSLLRDYKEKR